MKKILSCLTLCFCLLLSGVVFVACDKGGPRTISLQYNNSVLDVRLSCNGERLSANSDGTFVVENFSNVRVELFAKQFGYEFSDAKVSVNNQQRILVENKHYDAIGQTDTKVGYFLLPRLSSNAEIVIEGGKMLETTFQFSAVGIEDEDVSTKLKNFKLCTDGTNYVNFYDFLTGTQSSITRAVDNLSNPQDNYRTFKFMLDKPNLLDFSNIPFKFGVQQNQLQDVTNFSQEQGNLSFNVGDISSSKQCFVVADFSKVSFQEFSINFPPENMAYSITTNRPTVSYKNGAILTLNKKLSAQFADYSALVVKLDDKILKELEMPQPGPGVPALMQMQFEIPAKMVPENEKLSYNLTVEGIQFNVPTQSVSVLKNNQQQDVSDFIAYSVSALNENKVLLGPLEKDDEENYFALFGQFVQVEWQMLQNEDGYISPFQLLNYDVLLNEEKLFNLKEILSDATEDSNGNLVFQITNEKFSLKAIFNTQTNTFDSFVLQVKCEGEICITFQNFAEETVSPEL